MSIAIRSIPNTEFSYGNLGDLQVIVDEDGYMNATKLCKDAGKQFSHWSTNSGTKSYRKAVAKSTGIPDKSLSYVVTKGPKSTWGTFLHPDLMIKMAMWCSDEYSILVTRVMQKYHAKQAKKESKKLKKKIKKKDSQIDELKEMIRAMNAKNDERDREAARRDRIATKERRKQNSKMDDIKDDLTEVKSELKDVSGKLGCAKKQRVVPPDSPESEHILVILRHREEPEEDDASESEDGEYMYSVLRVQRKCLGASLANKRKHYPDAEVILELKTPNSMNLWNRFKERYGRRVDRNGIDMNLVGSYTEAKLIRDMTKLHRHRMTDLGL